MIRIIKPGSKPFIVLASVFVILLATISLFMMAGPREQSLEVLRYAGFILFLFAILSLNIWRTRIVIHPKSILIQRLAGSMHEVMFRDIAESIVEYLPDQKVPALLNIYTHDGSWPVLSLSLKPYRTADILWLLQLSQLKVSYSDGVGLAASRL